MQSVKFQAPEGVTSFSFQGIDIQIQDDGTVEASNVGMAEALMAHGFVQVDEVEEAAPVAAPTKGKRK